MPSQNVKKIERAYRLGQERYAGPFTYGGAPTAQTAYSVLLSPIDGFQKKAKIDVEGVKTVLQLRTKYGQPKKVLSDVTRYYDSSFYDAALRR